MRKIGLIVLALVLALGSVGVGYAMWQDTIWIDGTVTTGDLDINVVYVSGSKVYKIVDDGGIYFYYYVKDLDGNVVNEVNAPAPAVPPNILVAEADAVVIADDHVEMTFTNAFPTEYQGGARGLYADIIAHYDGSIPAHVTWGFFGQGPNADLADWLWANGFIDIYAFPTEVTILDDGISYTVNSTIPPRQEWQMHECDYIKVNVYVDLPQPEEIPADSGLTQEDFQNATIEFWLYLYATQWNE